MQYKNIRKQPKSSADEWKMLIYLLVSSMCLAHKKHQLGLPWWLSGKEFACQCRRHGFDPWTRKIPHAVKQLGLCTPAIEPVKSMCPTAHAMQQKPQQWNAWVPQWRGAPARCNQRNAHAATKTQCSQKQIKIFLGKKASIMSGSSTKKKKKKKFWIIKGPSLLVRSHLQKQPCLTINYIPKPGASYTTF